VGYPDGDGSRRPTPPQSGRSRVNSTIEESIPEGLVGERLDRVVAMLGDISRSAAARLVAQSAVSLDGKAVESGSVRVEGGQRIKIDLPDSPGVLITPDPSIPFEVVHEDDHIVIIDKPSGVVVHPGAGHTDATLVNGLVARYPEIASVGEPHRPGVVHRLDRGTSGLLVVARTQEAHDALVEQMSNHEPERIYAALVWGALDTDSGVIEAPIGRSNRQPTRMAVVQSGRPAVTHYRVDEKFHKPHPTTLLTCRLETGRTHQIRVHLSAIGHPVVGDRDYGGGRPGIDLGRPFLHARRLTLDHPVTGDAIQAESELPGDLVDLLGSLG